jgi:hypothetical protein
MAKISDIDIEVFDLGARYFSYATHLSLLANFMSQGRDLSDREQELREEADQLRGSIKRCRLEVEIEDHFSSVDDIMALLSTSRVEHNIANEIVVKHSRRQELVFNLASTISSISVANVQKMDSSGLCEVAHSLGSRLKIPDRLIEAACSNPQEGYSAIREHFALLQVKADEENQDEAPEDWQQAFIRTVWHSKLRVFYIILAVIIIALVTVWSTLPDTTKQNIINAIFN